MSGEGYTVSCLYSLTAGLDTVVRQNPDLVIMDYLWSMEDRNWSLLQSLRSDRRTRGTPVVLYPGGGRQTVEVSEQLTGMGILFARKSFDIDELLQLVSDALPPHHGSNHRHSHGDARDAGLPAASLLT